MYKPWLNRIFDIILELTCPLSFSDFEAKYGRIPPKALVVIDTGGYKVGNYKFSGVPPKCLYLEQRGCVPW